MPRGRMSGIFHDPAHSPTWHAFYPCRHSQTRGTPGPPDPTSLSPREPLTSGPLLTARLPLHPLIQTCSPAPSSYSRHGRPRHDLRAHRGQQLLRPEAVREEDQGRRLPRCREVSLMAFSEQPARPLLKWPGPRPCVQAAVVLRFQTCSSPQAQLCLLCAGWPPPAPSTAMRASTLT